MNDAHLSPPETKKKSSPDGQIGFSLKQLRHFTVLIESTSLAQAAQKLAISQSALTESLEALEGQLGVRLFLRRRAQGITPTKGGLDLMGHAQAVLAAAQDLKAMAEGRSEKLEGAVRIGCYSTLAPFILPQLLRAFGRHHPEAQLEIIEGSGAELEDRLDRGSCDIALTYKHNLRETTQTDTLYGVRPRVVLPASHPMAAQDEVALDALAQEPLVEFAIEPALSNTAGIFRDLGVESYKRGPKASTIELVRALVGEQFGYAVLLHHPEMNYAYGGQPLAVRPIKGSTHLYPVVLARSNYLKASRRSLLLRRFCLQVLRAPDRSAMPQQALPMD